MGVALWFEISHTLTMYHFFSQRRSASSNFSKQDVSRNIWILKAVAIANNGYLFAIAVMVDFLANRLDTGAEAVFYLEALSTTIFLALVIWIGIFSDRYSRKAAMLFGMALRFTGWALLIFASGFPLILLAFVFEAISSEMCKPSHCLYETMEAAEALDNYPKYEQRLGAFPLYFLVIGLPISGILYEINMIWPMILNAAVCAVAFGLLIFYKEPPRIKLYTPSFMQACRDNLSFLKQNKDAFYYLLFFSVIQSLALMVIFLFQAKYLTITQNLAFFAFLIPAIYAIRGYGAQMTSFFKTRLGEIAFLRLWVISLFLSMGLAGLTESLGFFVLFLGIFMFGLGFYKPVCHGAMNAMLTSDRRASILSIQSFIGAIIFVALNAVFGFGIELVGVGLTMAISAAVLAVLCGILLYGHYKTKSQ